MKWKDELTGDMKRMLSRGEAYALPIEAAVLNPEEWRGWAHWVHMALQSSARALSGKHPAEHPIVVHLLGKGPGGERTWFFTTPKLGEMLLGGPENLEVSLVDAVRAFVQQIEAEAAVVISTGITAEIEGDAKERLAKEIDKPGFNMGEYVLGLVERGEADHVLYARVERPEGYAKTWSYKITLEGDKSVISETPESVPEEHISTSKFRNLFRPPSDGIEYEAVGVKGTEQLDEVFKQRLGKQDEEDDWR